MTLSQVSGVGALEQVPGSTDIQNSTATENNNSTVKTDTFDEVKYSKEVVDPWMKANVPASTNPLLLLKFVGDLNAKIEADGKTYGDKDLVAKQYGAYMLYDIAFVGKSLFAGMMGSGNFPAPANGDYPEKVTETLPVLDKETNTTVTSTGYYVDQHSDKTVVMHGGFRNSWANGIDNVQTRLFYNRGYNILIVDNRASGLSEGNYITYGYYESDDMLAWINKEVADKPDQKILLDGGSMGAATTLSVLSKDVPKNVKGAVEDCGFASIIEQLAFSYDTVMTQSDSNGMVKQLLTSLGLTPENKQENLDRINRIYGQNYLNLDLNASLPLEGVEHSAIPKLFIHGTADTTVPYSNLAELSDNDLGYKQVLSVEGAGHGQSLDVDPDAYNKNLDQFLAVVFDDKVTVNYVDGEGNPLPNVAPVTLTGSYGDDYDVSNETYQKQIDGYILDQTKLPANMVGTFNDQAQTVTYVYNADKKVGADVTVKYQDTDGNSIAKDEVKSGNVGDAYTTEKKEITGYTFKEVKGDISGKISDKAQAVSYIYTKNKVTPDNSGSDSNSNSNSNSNSGSDAGSLPDTGDNRQSTMLLFVSGLALVIFSGVASFVGYKKRYLKK